MNDEQKPGQPAFLFVSRISEAERDKALAEAFEKAKQQATRLAKAAGAQLGALKSLAGNAAMGGGDYDVYQYGRDNSPSHQMMQAMRNRQSSGEEETVEAIGAEPGPVSINVSVTAAFDLAGKK
jgi:uncharacterized protein YggE